MIYRDFAGLVTDLGYKDNSKYRVQDGRWTLLVHYTASQHLSYSYTHRPNVISDMLERGRGREGERERARERDREGERDRERERQR